MSVPLRLAGVLTLQSIPSRALKTCPADGHGAVLSPDRLPSRCHAAVLLCQTSASHVLIFHHAAGVKRGANAQAFTSGSINHKVGPSSLYVLVFKAYQLDGNSTTSHT